MKLNVQRRFAGLEIAALAIRIRRYECAFKLGRVMAGILLASFCPNTIRSNSPGINGHSLSAIAAESCVRLGNGFSGNCGATFQQPSSVAHVRSKRGDNWPSGLLRRAMKMLWLAFVLGAILSWGVYVPTLHEGQKELGEGRPPAGAVRAFLCVGLAYFVTAVVVPLLLLHFDLAGGERLQFWRQGQINWRGISFATLAGAAGAAGALCIILSIKNGGSPLFIAPLVFAGAPIVNTLVSLAWHPPAAGLRPGPLFYVGIILAAVGAGLVLYTKADLDARSRAASSSIPAGTSDNVTAPSKPTP
jgi:uncharacterized membrane protein